MTGCERVLFRNVQARSATRDAGAPPAFAKATAWSQLRSEGGAGRCPPESVAKAWRERRAAEGPRQQSGVAARCGAGAALQNGM